MARAAGPRQRGSIGEVFAAFLKLGLTSFGGPVAHLGYFRSEFVQRRGWLDDASYTDLVALCQFLPGPASSQVGMALGLGRAGWAGALAAWLAFTLPSAAAMVLFALGVTQWNTLASSGALHGLKMAAVAVVAQAVLAMTRSLCPDRPRAGIAVVAALGALAVPGALGQVGAIVLGALAGHLLVPGAPAASGPSLDYGVSRRVGTALLLTYVALLVALPIVAVTAGTMVPAAIAVFYQAGALVFGGGHVILPLLQAGVVPPGWIDNDVFLAGYAAAQAVPGPLTTFAAFLGAVMPAPLGGWGGAALLLVVIFLPAFLVVAGALPFWEALRLRPAARRAMAGVNAAVVGLLAAALYDPLWTSAIRTPADFGVALAAFGLLTIGRVTPVLVVIGAAVAGMALAA